MLRPDLCVSTPQTNAVLSLKLSFWELFPRLDTIKFDHTFKQGFQLATIKHGGLQQIYIMGSYLMVME